MKTLLATALMVFGLAGPKAAQSAAVVAGSIVDQSGAPLAGVRVTIRGAAVRMAATGAAGDFAFSDVPNGDYEISAELSGFERDLQEIPAAITAVSQADLGRLGAQTIEEAPSLAPSVTFSRQLAVEFSVQR